MVNSSDARLGIGVRSRAGSQDDFYQFVFGSALAYSE